MPSLKKNFSKPVKRNLPKSTHFIQVSSFLIQHAGNDFCCWGKKNSPTLVFNLLIVIFKLGLVFPPILYLGIFFLAGVGTHLVPQYLSLIQSLPSFFCSCKDLGTSLWTSTLIELHWRPVWSFRRVRNLILLFQS